MLEFDLLAKQTNMNKPFPKLFINNFLIYSPNPKNAMHKGYGFDNTSTKMILVNAQ